MNEPLTHDIVLRCSLEHAFDTFTQRVNLWWPLAHRKFDVSTFYCEPVQGGALTEISNSGERFIWADLTDIDRPHTVELAWHPGKNTHPTKTEIVFQAVGPHETRIQLTHSEGHSDLGTDWPKRAALFDRGWTAVLAAIHEFIETERERE